MHQGPYGSIISNQRERRGKEKSTKRKRKNRTGRGTAAYFVCQGLKDLDAFSGKVDKDTLWDGLGLHDALDGVVHNLGPLELRHNNGAEIC